MSKRHVLMMPRSCQKSHTMTYSIYNPPLMKLLKIAAGEQRGQMSARVATLFSLAPTNEAF